MSKERARARAARAALAARQAEADRQRRQREAVRRARRARRDLTWRRSRLWRHGAGFRRHKEAWAALITVVLGAVLITYLVTSSLDAVVVVVLVCLIAMPALAVMMLDRRTK